MNSLLCRRALEPKNTEMFWLKPKFLENFMNIVVVFEDIEVFLEGYKKGNIKNLNKQKMLGKYISKHKFL